MARYRMDDNTVVNTDKATGKWNESTRWNGRNHISKATGDQWEHQTLYRSTKERYYLVRWSDYQDRVASAEYVECDEAALWLLTNDHELPEDLKVLELDIEE